jgi:hypothetical protein
MWHVEWVEMGVRNGKTRGWVRLIFGETDAIDPERTVVASRDLHRIGTVLSPIVEQSRAKFQAVPSAAGHCRAFSRARVASSREMFSWRRWLFSSRRRLVRRRM